MATFAYKAKDRGGAVVEGTIEADGRPAVVTRLQSMGYFPISITQGGKPAPPPPAKGGAPAKPVSAPLQSRTAVPKQPAAPAAAAKRPASVEPPRPGMRKRMGSGELAGFNRQLADLIGAGVPLVKALGILGKQAVSIQFSEVLATILADVESGMTFADSLAKHPRLFSKLYVAMVRAGEAGGMLDEVLQRLADFSENEEQLRGRVKAALAYPMVMVVAGTGAVIVMFTFVVPKITKTFEQLGQALPYITQVLIAISTVMEQYWWGVLLAIAAIAVGFVKFTESGDGREAWHKAQLRMPIVGEIVQKREVARFARTLGSLLKNGVSILTALEIVREVVNNVVFQREVDRMADEITQGATVAKPLRESRVFPPVAVNMISIGEETGRLPEVLLRVSESFEIQVERNVRTLTSLLEPIIIVVMGLVVGFIVIAMLLPIFSLDPTGGKV